MRMLIMGAPGSGKGTQSERIAIRLGIPTISTGAMLRSVIAEVDEAGAHSELGKRVAEIINQGALVPDETMIALVMERLTKDDCKNGYILDGFPRTYAQAEAMDRLGMSVDVALLIDVPDETIISRLAGRRVCKGCGATYHVEANPSEKGNACGICDTSLTVREDDKPDTIVKRLETYHKQTEPIMDYYRQRGVLVTVKSQELLDATTVLVLDALKQSGSIEEYQI